MTMEIERPEIGPVTDLNNNMKAVFNQYKALRKYANKLEAKIKKLEFEVWSSRYEQEKVKIPRFVAKFIEEKKQHRPLILFEIGTIFDNNNEDENEIRHWLFDGSAEEDSDNQEKFMRAWVEGYEVEQEQKYIVPIYENKNGFKGTDKGFTKIFLIKDGYAISSSYDFEKLEESKTKEELYMTKSEIEAVDPKYLEFAVKVEDEE